MSPRPRLRSSVQARRHLRGDDVCVVLHRGSAAMKLGEREWRVVRAMDGTRDAEGIALASGVARAHVAAFVEALERAGFLGEDQGGGDPAAGEPSFARDLPVLPLPGYRFTCDGRGACCATFATMAFTPLEAARARAAAPEIEHGGHDPDRVFTPHAGLDGSLLAVAMRDGACVYRSDAGCRVHAAAGAEAKPLGCRTYPMRHVDVGDAIRVAPRPECDCVFASGRDEITDATRGADLPRALYVDRLGPVRMGPETVSAQDFIRWCDARRPEDAAAWCAGTADAVAQDGARAEGRPGEIASLHAAARAIAARAEQLAAVLADHRGPRDPLRRRVDGLLEAAARIGEGAPAVDDERLYLTATLFGGWLADEPSVELALRERGARIMLARAFPPGISPHPLGVVESLARGHGLAAAPSGAL